MMTKLFILIMMTVTLLTNFENGEYGCKELSEAVSIDMSSEDISEKDRETLEYIAEAISEEHDMESDEFKIEAYKSYREMVLDGSFYEVDEVGFTGYNGQMWIDTTLPK